MQISNNEASNEIATDSARADQTTDLSQKTIEAPQENKEVTSNEDPNWRAFREARKRDRAEREAAERRAAEKEAEALALKAAMEAAFSKLPAPGQDPSAYRYEVEESEDEKIEKKVNAILAAREQQALREAQEREQREYPQRLQQTYPDFHQVISQENLDYLDFHYPEVSRPLQRLNNGFDKWSDIYQAIKKFVPNSVNAKREAARADINQSKPKSISSPTMTNTGEPVRVSWQDMEQRRAANWERMQRVMKGLT